MKLVINTQHKENDAVFNDDYVHGVSAPYWRFKGGFTYVVEGLSEADAERINAEGIPTLTALIESYSEGFEEVIIGAQVVQDDVVVCEEWDTPWMLTYDRDATVWRATRDILNGEYGYFNADITAKRESYVLGEAGTRIDYTERFCVDCTFITYNAYLSRTHAA